MANPIASSHSEEADDEPVGVDETTFVVIDFEATTPSGRRPAPVEVAAAAVHLTEAGSLTRASQFDELMRPPEDAPLTRWDIDQTGIRAEDLQHARSAADVMADLDTWLPGGPCLLVAHNAPTEAGLIYDHRDHCPRLAKTYLIDTIKMARLVLPDLGSHRLDELIHRLRIPSPGSRHRAMPDVQITTHLLQRLWQLGITAGHWTHSPTGLTALQKAAGLTPKACRPEQTALF